MTSPLRLLIVDDDDYVRRLLALRIRLEPGITLVGEAADGASALVRALSASPHVVLLDLNLIGETGLDVCARLHATGAPVVMFSLDDDEETSARCLAAGASAFVSKRAPARELFAALRGARRQDGQRAAAASRSCRSTPGTGR